MEQQSQLVGYIIGNLKQEPRGFNFLRRRDYTGRYSYRDILDVIKAVGQHRCSGFVIDEQNGFAYENLAKWLVGDATLKVLDPVSRRAVPGELHKGIYLAGATGTGKTYAMEILSYIADRLGLCFEHRAGVSALAWNNIRADGIVRKYTQTGNFSMYIGGPDVIRSLCIQDLGSESTEATYMGSRVDVIRQIIEARADNGSLLTLFTSNNPLWNNRPLIDKYGDRAFDRLRGMCNYLEMTGQSRRK